GSSIVIGIKTDAFGVAFEMLAYILCRMQNESCLFGDCRGKKDLARKTAHSIFVLHFALTVCFGSTMAVIAIRETLGRAEPIKKTVYEISTIGHQFATARLLSIKFVSSDRRPTANGTMLEATAEDLSQKPFVD